MNDPVHAQLLHTPDCPLVDRVRDILNDCLDHVRLPVTVEELEGPYPSPSLVINGIDVATGEQPRTEICCRFDLPTPAQILAAVKAEAGRADRGRGSGPTG